MTVALYGTGVSRGIAIGRAHPLPRNHIEVAERPIASHEIDAEIGRYRAALAAAAAELNEVRSRIPQETPVDVAAFVDTHLLMIDDYMLAEAPVDLIRDRRCNAEWALMLQRHAVAGVFEAMQDAYLRTRKDDVDHVIQRVLRILIRQGGKLAPGTAETALHGAIVVADDLSPADALALHQQGVLAWVTEFGASVSHAAILARSLGIPAVAAAHNACLFAAPGETLIVDGARGVVIAGADATTQGWYEQRRDAQWARLRDLAKLARQPSRTRDKVHIALHANIELASDIEAVHEVAASAVGLYRTEFLFLNRDEPPGEDEQYETYVQVIRALHGLPLTIRTLDLGADKAPAGAANAPVATNPALGLRAIRLCLREPALFVPQLRAILRAAAHGPVRLMLPLLSSPTEVVQVRTLIRQIREDLRREGLRHEATIPVGGMIEVPAAAIAAPVFARSLDFLSIGTNDLIQYTLAVDRMDDEVAYLYDPLNPAVLMLLSQIVTAAHNARIPLALCGELAGDPRYTRLLVGLGLTELSMRPFALPEIKSVVRDTEKAHVARLARRMLDAGDHDEIERLFEMLNEGLEW